MVETTAWPTKHRFMISEGKEAVIRHWTFLHNDSILPLSRPLRSESNMLKKLQKTDCFKKETITRKNKLIQL